jgi:hypothetical protein
MNDRDREREPEVREVRVAEPQLSDQTNDHLTDEVRDVVGTDRVVVPPGRPRVSRGERAQASGGRLAAALPNNFIIVMVGASFVVIAAIIALLIGDWWVLPSAVVVLGAVTAAIVATVFRMTNVRERPSPSMVAALEEEGVRDPERHFSELVAEYTENTGGKEQHLRTAAVEDDAPKAAAEQESAITPSGGPTEPSGPGGPP